MQDHLARANLVRGLQRLGKPRGDDRAQLGILVVDIKPFVGAVNADAALMPVKRCPGGGYTVFELGLQSRVGHEVLQFDVARGVEQPISMVGNLGCFKASAYLERGHVFASLGVESVCRPQSHSKDTMP